MPGTCHFQLDWLSDPAYKDWIARDNEKTTVARCTKCSASIDVSTMGKTALTNHSRGKNTLKMSRHYLVMAKEWQLTWRTNLSILEHLVQIQPSSHHHSIQVDPVRVLLHHVVRLPLIRWKLKYGGAFTSLIRISLSLQIQTLGFCSKACFQIHT